MHARRVVLQTSVHKGVMWRNAGALTPLPFGVDHVASVEGVMRGKEITHPGGKRRWGKRRAYQKVLNKKGQLLG